MNIPLRIVEYKEESRVEKFSAIEGVKTILSNVKILFMHRLVAGSLGWKKIDFKQTVVSDVSLVFKDGTAEFIKTPEDAPEAVLEISQRI